MTESETIKTEVARVMSRAYPPLIMSLDDVADLLGLSKNYVRNDLQHSPEFPRKLDRFKSPRWSRDDVMQWAGVNLQ